MGSLLARGRTATVLAFGRRRSKCAMCTGTFTPLRPEHRLCRNCWQWAQIGLAIDRTAALFAELRKWHP